jgi:hypothetical protein
MPKFRVFGHVRSCNLVKRFVPGGSVTPAKLGPNKIIRNSAIIMTPQYLNPENRYSLFLAGKLVFRLIYTASYRNRS